MRIYLVFTVLIVALSACSRSGEIKVQNKISRTTISNVYWGEHYVGGSLKPGQETEFFEIKPRDEKLPASYPVIFTVETSPPIQYYSIEYYELNKNGQLVIELTDSTAYYEL